MARFFSVLSGSVPTTLSTGVSTGYFNSRSISDGVNKRNGLIASRSAVSTDIYNELDAVNKDGSRGTYFPPDLLQTVGSPLLLSGSVYTSSVAGIRTPTTNTYGSGVVNYSLRPTASIISTQTTLVTASSPLDSADVNNNTYLSASNAVKAVLDSITGGGPYGRLGLNSSRTLHSIWHDPDLGYFAWDDFTPGQLPSSNLTRVGTNTPSTQSLFLATNIYGTPGAQFLNDTNTASPIALQLSIGGGGCDKQLTIASGSASLGTNASGTGPTNCFGGGNSTWDWDAAAGELEWNLGVSAGGHTASGFWTLHDPIIQTHTTTSIALDITFTLT